MQRKRTIPVSVQVGMLVPYVRTFYHADSMVDQDITPKVLLEHIQGMRFSLEKRMDRMEGDIHFLKVNVSGLQKNVSDLGLVDNFAG